MVHQSKSKSLHSLLPWTSITLTLKSLVAAVSSCLTLSAVSPDFVSSLDSGNRAQLSADAGQRRPSQKEKYVSPQDHLSPL